LRLNNLKRNAAILEVLGINAVKISDNGRYGQTIAPLPSQRHRYTEYNSDYEEEE
jgi:hypothetical protein